MRRRTVLGGAGLAGLAGAGVTAYRVAPAFWKQFSKEWHRPILPAPRTPRPDLWPDRGLYAAWLGHATVLIKVDGITILDLSGRITLGEGSITLRDSVHDALDKGSKNILLNLAQISYIDSSGVGELVSAFTSVKNAGGELKLLNLTQKVHDLLQITKLYTVFDIWDNEASAIGAFN